MYRSTDGGATFAASNSGLPALNRDFNGLAVFDTAFHPTQPGVVAAATIAGPMLSRDGGVTWSTIRGDAVPASFTAVAWSGTDLYAATWGAGVLRLRAP
jgi:hypothetical protein